jgi:acyl dehydratase/putative sterol carrier protein
MVVFLASEAGKTHTGHVFGVQGQRIHLYEVKTNEGVEKPGAALWTAQEIGERIGDIMRWEAPAAAAAAPVQDVVTQVFAHFPAGYKPAAAPGWKATIQWVVKGGTSQTVIVDDGGAKVAVGLVGSPTCTVKTDTATLLALFKGEMDPAKAFMTGKASADNMGDLMKMGMAFDFKKVAAAFEAAGGAKAPAAAAAAPAVEVDVVSQVFAHFPAGFKSGAVPGWKATIQWQVKGGTDQTITIDPDGAKTSAGLTGAPTCTVKIDKDTLIAMFKGEMDPAKAFMGGKAQADNMGDLMKLGMAFDFKKVAAAFTAANPGAAAAAAPVKAAEPAREKTVPIGKRYEHGFWYVDRAQYEAFAKATDDNNPAYFGPNSIAPPMFHTRPFIELMMKLATDPEIELDLLRLVHGEHDVTFHRVLKHGDILQLRGTLKSLEEKSSGRVVTYGLFGFVDGELAIEGTTSYFIRGMKKEGEKKETAAAPEPLPTPDLVVAEAVTVDQPIRYSKASGDENPIHVDPATAKAAGLPGVILHGLCTMAFAQRDIVNASCGGDPRRLRRLGVRFARPVFPGHTLSLKVWKDNHQLQFITENDEGQVVISNGRAEIRA